MTRYRPYAKERVAEIFEREVFGFISTDIRREIQLAHRTSGQCPEILPGAGNVLAAMGLLAATEFVGWIWKMADANSRHWADSDCFEAFFREMGYGHLVRGEINLYTLRSDLLHRYSVGARDIRIDMGLPDGARAIQKEADGWHLLVEAYFRDFSTAADRLYERLTGKSAAQARSAVS